MLCRMDHRLAQNIPRIRNGKVVNAAVAEMLEPRFPGRAAPSRQKGAARPAVQIDAQSKFSPSQLAGSPDWSNQCLPTCCVAGVQNLVDTRVPRQQLTETGLDEHRDLEVRPPGLQEP